MSYVPHEPLCPSHKLYVVCRSAATAEAWRRRAAKLPRVDVHTILDARSYYKVINDLIASGSDQPVLVAHDDIRCGFDFARAVDSLLAEIGERFTRWGVCGNAGIAIDGRHLYRFLRDPHGGPKPTLAIEPVQSVDGNLLLLNIPALSAAGVKLPDFAGFHGYDLAISYESWLHGLPVLCDRRLFVLHHSGGDQQGFDAFCNSATFRRYLAARFINSFFYTLNGLINLDATQDYHFLDYARDDDRRRDLIDVCDMALVACRKVKPTLTIACRTQLNRPELLLRAMTTFAAATVEAADYVDIKVTLVSDQPEAALAAEASRIRQRLPGLPLNTCHFSTPPGRYSRLAALLAAITQCSDDYLWFVDDDDFIYPPAMRTIARHLSPGLPRLIVGNARRFEERWTTDGQRSLIGTLALEPLPASGIFHAFEGDNHTPICAAIYPTNVLKERIRTAAALGDYYEDYFLMMLVLTAPNIEIRCLDVDLCGISLRAGENTVGEIDREHWDFSYVTFMSELLRLQPPVNPLLWQLGTRGPQQPLQIAHRPVLEDRLALRLWPLLLRRTLSHLRQTGWRNTLAKVRRYLTRR